jgi:hypothetical protein
MKELHLVPLEISHYTNRSIHVLSADSTTSVALVVGRSIFRKALKAYATPMACVISRNHFEVTHGLETQLFYIRPTSSKSKNLTLNYNTLDNTPNALCDGDLLHMIDEPTNSIFVFAVSVLDGEALASLEALRLPEKLTAEKHNDLACPICLETLTCPVSLPCGHTACGGCVWTHFQSQPDWVDGKCFMCRKRTRHVFEIKQNVLISQMSDAYASKTASMTELRDRQHERALWKARQKHRLICRERHKKMLATQLRLWEATLT